MRAASPRLSRRSVLAGGVAVAALPAMAAQAKRGISGVYPTSPLFKATEFVRRRAELTPEAFLDHWRRTREPLARALPGLVGLVFNTRNAQRDTDARYDGAVEYWFQDAKAYSAALDDVHGPIGALNADLPRFIEPDVLALFTEEVMIRRSRSGQAPSAKRLGLVGRRPEMSRAAFVQSWRDEHAPTLLPRTTLERYILNPVIGPRVAATPWDGYAELWWTDWAAYDDGFAQYLARPKAAGPEFFHSHLLSVVDEHISLLPPTLRGS